MKMDSRKTGHSAVTIRQPVHTEAEKITEKDVAIVHASLQTADLLALEDEFDGGNDPYNNTGQHVALGASKKS